MRQQDDLFMWAAPPAAARGAIGRPDQGTLDIRCCTCGTEDWIRCEPGLASDASSISPNNLTSAIAILPGVEIPPIAFCASCDPSPRLRGQPASRTPGTLGEIEYRSWIDGLGL